MTAFPPNWLEAFLYDIKITDVLLVAFTGLLAVYTGRLWYATKGLWDSAKEQAGDMRKSVIAATDAANAAITSNQIAVTNAEQQLRAYVTVQEVSMETHRLPDRPGTLNNNIIPGNIYAYRFSVILKNGGATPATNAKINISHARFNNEIPADYLFPDSAVFGHALIGPQTAWHSPTVLVPAAEIENPLVGGVHYLYGWIEYDDIFHGTFKHRTEFCFRIACERMQPTNEPWIAFIPHSKFNAADGGCLRPFDPHENRYG